MRARSLDWLATAVLVAVLTACGDDDGAGPTDGGPSDLGSDATTPDTGPALDTGPVHDVGPADDAGPSDDAAPAHDAGPAPDGGPGEDAGPADAGPAADAGPGEDAGPSGRCESRGGACVPVIPDACADGIIGDPREFSCGGGLGVMCCLPDRPVCMHEGTREEGWYLLDGTMLCAASCAGAVATCDAIGTRSEGWYAPRDDQGCMLGRLIVWDMCG